MPRVEDVPENRPGDPAPVPTGSAPRTTRDLPAQAREGLAGLRLTGDEQSPAPRLGPRSSATVRAAWLLSVLALAVSLVTLRVVQGPELMQQVVSAATGTLLAVGLAVRSGGWGWLTALMAVAVGAGAVLSQWPPLMAGAAVATGVVASCLAVLGTRPAVTFTAVVREVVLALVLATIGGFAIAGFSVPVDAERVGYAVLALAVLSSLLLVYRLGGGLHGLGGRGVLLAAVALVLLVVIVVYVAALTRYGTPELVDRVQAEQNWTRKHFGGVPHPVSAIVGIPALTWGIAMRARRRQGWWACAFGAAATAEASTRLLDGSWDSPATALAAAYTLVLGLLGGFFILRFERLLTGRGGRLAFREAAADPRPEPGRLQPLH